MTFCGFGRKSRQGGGPYGQGVTRGQDLTGMDFSGKSLIKQDFKTASFFCFVLIALDPSASGSGLFVVFAELRISSCSPYCGRRISKAPN